jgi:hypothetical protein
MAYTQQIRILESKLAQLRKGPHDVDNIQKTFELEATIKRLKRLEWIENYETVKMDEER